LLLQYFFLYPSRHVGFTFYLCSFLSYFHSHSCQLMKT
jgi:hypothetical protein